MTLTLTAQDQARLAEAIRVLAAPFGFDTPKAWMRAVGTSYRDAVGAATGNVVMPAGSDLRTASAFYSEDELKWYLTFFPLLERVGALRRSTRSGVVTRREAYGPHYDEMQRTAYVREFLPAVRGYDSLTVGVPWRPRGAAADEVVHVVLNADDPNRPFAEDQVAIARLLQPALEAGVSAYQQLAAASDNLGALLDAGGAACAAFSSDGRLFHRTPALGAILEREPRREALIERARLLAQHLDERRAPSPERIPAPVLFAGARGPYTLTPVFVRDLAPQPSILVAVTPPPADDALPSADMIGERFGLSPRQAEVALLLAERHSNKEIAAALSISVHTARHHVEAVLSYLDVPRSAVPDALHGLAVS